MYNIVGHCPHCGAPIYVHEPNRESTAVETFPPKSIYSCECRFNIPSLPYYPPCQKWPPYTITWGESSTNISVDNTDATNLTGGTTCQ